MTASRTGDVYAREVVMARVGHLIRRKQHEIERITASCAASSIPSGYWRPSRARSRVSS
jgi:hypothetical protein